jgi:RecA-family ATPase
MERFKIIKKKDLFNEASETSIIYGLMTSTEYITKIRDVWDGRFIIADAAEKLAEICLNCYDQYKQAPGKEKCQELVENELEAKPNKNLEVLYDQLINKKDTPTDRDNGLSIALNEEEQKEFNVQYLVDGTKALFKRRYLELHLETVNALKASGQFDEAEKLIKEYKPLTFAGSNKIDNYIWTLDEMRELIIEEPLVLMQPWLKAGQVTFIYADMGVGKTLLAVHIASLLALDKNKTDGIAEWKVENPTGCLYVDGEMGMIELKDRISQFEYLGEPLFPICSFIIPKYQLDTEDMFILSERENQRCIINWLKANPSYKLLILDSVTTLFGLTDENSSGEWINKIQPFIRDLKALDVATIILHHSGKEVSRGLRGSSSMGAMAHYIFCLTNHPDKENVEDEGEAWFTLGKQKQRAGGYKFRKFSLHYTQDSALTETYWDETQKEKKKDEGLTKEAYRAIRMVLYSGLTQTKIAERIGCKQPNIAQYVKRAKKLGFLTADNEPTALWEAEVKYYSQAKTEEDNNGDGLF